MLESTRAEHMMALRAEPLSDQLASTHRPTSTISTTAAVCTILVGALVLVGWAAGIEALKRVFPDLVAMNPMTACALMLAGTAIGCHDRGARLCGVGAGALVLAIGAFKLADIATAVLPIDRWLFSDLLNGAPGARPNRMAPNTAASFVLLGGALILVSDRRARHRDGGQILAIGVLLISTFAVLGLAFGIDHLSTVGPFIPMALPTGCVCSLPRSAHSRSIATRR
jgi:hypothetical protein